MADIVNAINKKYVRISNRVTRAYENVSLRLLNYKVRINW